METRLAPTQPRSGSVYDGLLTAIRDGRYSPSDRLPSEGALASMTGASRATVREALTQLQHAGYIVRRHGSGTYVAPRAAIAHGRIDRYTTLTELIRENGHSPSIVDWRVAEVAPPPAVALALELSRIDTTWRVARTYLAGRIPAAYCVAYVPTVWHGHQIEKPATPGELRWQVEQTLGVTVSHLVSAVEAVPASPECATALRIPESTPLLLIRSLNILDDGRPVMFGFNYNDSSVIASTIVQVRPSAGSGVE